MRPGDLTPRDRRALRLGVALISLMVVSRAMPSLFAWRAESLRSSELVLESVAVAREAALRMVALERTVAAMRDDVALTEMRLLHTGSPAAASAALATRISDAARSAGMRVESMQAIPMPTDTAGASTAIAYPAVRVRGEVAGDIEGIVTLLQLIESDSLLLIVRELQISQPQVALADDQPEVLATSIVVEARTRLGKPTP